MIKKLSLLLLLFIPIACWAQNPTAVTGTITADVAYYPAQVTACLSPVTTDPLVGGKHVNPNIGTNYCIGPVPTTSTGAFSMGLHANANITCTPACGATTWIFTVTAIGSAPPAGTGAQTFQSSGITIAGSSQDVGATLSALAPKLVAGGGAPGGSNTQVQYNKAGAFAGSSGLVFNDSTGQITLGGTGGPFVTPFLFIEGSGGGGTLTVGVNNGTTSTINLGAGAGGISLTAPNSVLTLSSGTAINSPGYQTATNCSSSSGTCGSAAAGAVSIAAAATTVTVATTAVTANSDIQLTRNDALSTRLSVTCNTATAAGDIKVSTITAATSFVITVQNAPVTNPLCLTYSIVN